MKIDLKDYLEERERLLSLEVPQGPVITISRDYGCDEHPLVNHLISRMSQYTTKGKNHAWTSVNREILEDASFQLGMNTFDVDHRVLLHHVEKVNSWFSAFTHKFDLPDKAIFDKVKEVMLAYAKKGNVIIVGRGGVDVVRSIENSVHFKLTAPFAYRVGKIAELKGISVEEAESIVKKMDHDRKAWIENLIDHELDVNEFDAVFNVSRLGVDEITEMILGVMKQKGMITLKDLPQKSA